MLLLFNHISDVLAAYFGSHLNVHAFTHGKWAISSYIKFCEDVLHTSLMDVL